MADVQSEVRLNDRLCTVPTPSLIAALPTHQRPNSYTCPLGRPHGTAWVLMLRGDIDAIIGDASFTLTMKAEFENDDEQLTIPSLTWKRATRLNIGGPEDTNAPYLIELVDQRWQLERFSSTELIMANIRSAAQASDYLTGTAGSWNDFIQALWESMPILGGYPGGITGTSVPEGYDVRNENPWPLLNTLLANLGKAIKYNPLTATFSIVTIIASGQTIPDGYQERLHRDTEIIEHNATRAPATIRVAFNRWYKNYGQEQDTEIDGWQSNDASEIIDVATGVAGAVPGTVLVLWDDLYATLDQDNTEDNIAAYTARANARAAAWLADASIDQAQTNYIGFLSDVLPGPRFKSVQWRQLGTGPETILVAAPGQLTSAYERMSGDGSTAPEELTSPDLSRRTFPNYPRLINTVQVNDGSELTDLIDPNSDNMFAGFVTRVEGQITAAGAGVLAEKEACWIRFVDEHDTNLGDVKAKNLDFFTGRLSGSADSSGSVRPLYVARRGSIAPSSSKLYGKANENWRKGGDDGDATLSGTLTAVNGSAAIVGVGTFFTTELTPGSTLLIDGDEYNILSITDNTNLVLVKNFTGTGAGGYAVQKPSIGSAPTVPWVRVNPSTDITGATPDFATTHIVFWANFKGGTESEAADPNVEAGQVIAYGTGPDDAHATEGYYSGKLLDIIMTTRVQTPDTELKQGWRQCDGTANGTDNGGSGVDFTCRMARGHPDDQGAGDQRGTETHFHRLNDEVTTAVLVEVVETGGTGIFVRPQDVPAGFRCTDRHADSDTECDCTGTFSDCDPLDPVDGEGFCEVPVEYTTIHYIERIDNSQGFLDNS